MFLSKLLKNNNTNLSKVRFTCIRQIVKGKTFPRNTLRCGKLLELEKVFPLKWNANTRTRRSEKGVLMTVLIECRSQLGRLHYFTFVGTGKRVGRMCF